MNFRKAKKNDISIIVQMIADDELGKKRENFQRSLPKEYLKAFENISSDENQELLSKTKILKLLELFNCHLSNILIIVEELEHR